MFLITKYLHTHNEICWECDQSLNMKLIYTSKELYTIFLIILCTKQSLHVTTKETKKIFFSLRALSKLFLECQHLIVTQHIRSGVLFFTWVTSRRTQKVLDLTFQIWDAQPVSGNKASFLKHTKQIIIRLTKIC